MKQTFEQARDATRETVSQIASWCIIIAAHQKDHIGASRHERVVKHMDTLRKEFIAQMLIATPAKAKQFLRDRLPAGARADFPVPLNRWAKNRREEQLRMAADDAASTAWVLFAVSYHEALGYGKERLNALRQEAIDNYRQFGDWSREDKDWALDRLRRCAEAALHEDLVITDEDEPRQKIAEDGLRESDRQVIRQQVTVQAARAQRPAGWAVLNQAKLLEQFAAQR